MIAIGPVSARTDDGWHLRGEILAEGSRPAVALLLHAMMASRRSMDKPRGAGLASTLAAAGLSVVSMDLRGHGESGPSAREGARYTYDDYILYDVPALVALTRSLFPGKPVIVVGHSLGAHAALASAGVFPDKAPDAVASIAGNFWFPSDEPSFARRAAKAATLRTWLAVAEAVGHFDPKPFRIGSDAVPLPYIRQFWKVWSSDRYASVDDRYDYAEALTRVTCPVFAVASEGDKLLAHPASVTRFFSRIGSTNKTLRIVTHAEHEGRAPDHMGLVTDPRALPVWREIAEWATAIA
ncbi:alpha/beta fold hydrolase [Polyangium sp. 6x1]|uniref:alpha/beta fold hydrolase n=1 Tax=Polyangium sp. 6x1 TaxID=3042689 RepID=UPI002482779F|nr:alpha/beta fold hydrolase [Polyangium sp. 6x1]MDI1446083.1 alpha/beta fold hydrolase [Polyangium sp. 6x1]